MDLDLTRLLFAIAAAIVLASAPAVRWPPRPASSLNWIPWHYLCLTGLAGVMMFGIHWLHLAAG